MPRGLQSVVQPFEVDDSKYNFNRMIARHVEFNAVIDGTIDKIGKLNAALGSLPDAKRISIEVSGVDAAIAKVGTLKAALDSIPDTKVVKIVTVGGGDGGGGNFGTFGGGGVSHIRDYNRMLDDYNAAMGEAVAQNRAFNDAQGETARLSRDGRNALSDLRDALGLTRDSATAAQLEIAKGFMADMPLVDQMVSKLGVAKEAYAGIGDASTPLGFTTSHVNALNDALARTRVNADGVTRALSDTEAIKARIMAGSGGYSGAQPGVYYNPFLGGGGGGGIWPAVAQPSSGDGGGGGGFAAAAGAAFGAMRPSNLFGAALPTVKMAHMITMFVMESLSTIIPAAVAAGAAGAVGLQGGTNVYTSGTGLYNANEALGGAYGKTFGSYLGLGSSFQAAQNMANGGVYGIAGGVLNLAGQGRDAFSNMGVQTVGMIDRGIANMVLNNRMTALSNAVSGGTGDLRAFGDVASNIGNTLLNLAPNLPGLGPDLLGGLKGITGAASFITGHTPSTLLAGGLAAEAGYRWGDLALSGGKMPWFLGGKQVGGLAGVAERMGLGTVADAGAGVDAAGLAGVLSEGAGPIGLGAALSAFAMTQLASTMPTKSMRQMAGLQAGVNAQFGVNTWTPLTHALYTATGGEAGVPSGGIAGLIAHQYAAMQTPSSYARFGPGAGMGPTAAGVYQNAAGSFAQQLGDLVAAGPQAVKALQTIGVKGASVSQAFDIMTEAMVPLADIGPGGKINANGRQLMKQFMTTYAPMTGTGPGAILGAASAQDIMSFSGMKSLSTINQAMDSVSQIMTGGSGGAAALFGMLGGTSVTSTRGGLRIAASAAPGTAAFAKAAASPFTAAGASAWSTLAGQNGLLPTEQGNLDQLRTALTLGALSSGQAGQMGAFQLEQLLPMARHSPALLANLMSMGASAGIPGMQYFSGSATSGANLARQYAIAQAAISRAAPSAARANALNNQEAVKLSNLPQLAASLITSQSGTNAIDLQQASSASQQALAVQAALATGGSTKAPLGQLVATLLASGVKSPAAMRAGLGGVLGAEGIGGSALSGLIKQGLVIYKAEYDKTNPPPKHGDVHWTDVYSGDKPKPKSGTVNWKDVFSHSSPPPLTGTVTYVASFAPTPSGSRSIGAGGAFFPLHHQSGYRVPGYGGGDTVPAMLEPGEAVVPKHLVPQLAPFLGANKVPGFAAGGLAGLGIFEYDTGKSIQALAQAVSGLAASLGANGAGAPMPAAAQKVFNAYDATLPKGIWGQFASQMLQGLIDGVKNAPHETAKMAKALVSQVTQAVTYGQGVAASAKQGGGYNPWGGGSTLLGTFGNFATPTTTAQGQPYQYYTDQQAAAGGGTLSVQQQMGDYLQAMKSFQGDLGKLSKAGLNKNLMQQLIAAGPLQGDQEAQSILGGAGGAGAANKLWNQIGKAANQLGTSTAGNIYGGGKGVKIPVHADTAAAQAAINQIHGKSVVISVSLDFGGHGGGGGAGGGVHLSTAQVKQVTAQVQAALLKQAKTNRRTGVSLPGYGT